MRLAPYPKYKPSGVEWLGDVPAHWEVFHLKRHYIVVNGGTPLSTEDSYWDGGIHWITPEDLGKNRSKYIGGTRRTLSIEGLTKCGAELVPINSIVLSTRAPIGYAAVTQQESCTNQGCRTLVPEGNRAYSDYLYYVLVASRPLLEAVGKGTTFMELSADLLGLHIVPFPPNSEQRAIADFLDREAAKIDTLIDKKQTLIERLQEKRAALITRTVTRGLPPNAARATGLESEPKMKASGVEWLQEIPGHWEYKGISLLARRGAKMFTDGDWVELPYITTDGIRLLQTGNIGVGQYREQGFRYIDESSFTELRCTEVQPADVLICRLADPVGRACLAPDLGCRMITSVDVCILKPADFMDARYIVYLLSSKGYLDFVESICRGGTRDRISRSMLGAIRVPVPSRLEQRAIADFLDRETAKIDGLVAKVETAIARLREYRAALITAAVTGQVDVRGEGP